MIEVEKKLHLTAEQEARVVADAEFLREKTMRDVYFDTPDFVFTTKDWWLRQRDEKWELKIPLHELGTTRVGFTSYRELEDENEIAEALGLERESSFAEDLQAAGFVPVADVTTTRRQYQAGEFHIDIDQTDFGYTLAEIELMMSDESQEQIAREKINAFLKSHGLSDGLVRGKILEYIFRNNKSHYLALEKAGIV